MTLRTLAALSLVLLIAGASQANVYVQAGVEADDVSVFAGVSDGVLADVGPAQDPAPASPEALDALSTTVDRMTERWETLDAACDPVAVFALLYLVTTETVVAHIEDGFFDDNEFVAWWTIAFAERYEVAIDAWMEDDTDAISQPWLDAFQRTSSGQTTVTEDALLGINVHVNYDLGLVTEAEDIVEEQRKEDYDRINEVLAASRPDSRQALEENYDPAADEDSLLGDSSLLVVYAWREEAWTHAEALTNLPTAQAQDGYQEGMATNTLIRAEALVTPKTDEQAQQIEDDRLAYCQQQNQPA